MSPSIKVKKIAKLTPSKGTRTRIHSNISHSSLLGCSHIKDAKGTTSRKRINKLLESIRMIYN